MSIGNIFLLLYGTGFYRQPIKCQLIQKTFPTDFTECKLWRSIPNGFHKYINPKKRKKKPLYTAQKMKFSIKDFFSKCEKSFTGEILNGKLQFFVQSYQCSRYNTFGTKEDLWWLRFRKFVSFGHRITNEYFVRINCHQRVRFVDLHYLNWFQTVIRHLHLLLA